MNLRCLSRAGLVACALALLPPPAPAEPPRLVLQITVDQLRGDMLVRYRSRFGAGGFRRLLDSGTYFADANFETANTFTASGHAVLVTGAATAEHGMVANEWFDRAKGRTVYCTEDDAYPVLDDGPGTMGMSPQNLTSTTLGDELVLGTGRRSRAFAVAGKDRSAIIPGGHLGKAFWFSESRGVFASSRYYYPRLPDWVAAWDRAQPYRRYRDLSWKPLQAPESYLNRAEASNLFARPNPILGRIFPHPLVARSDPLFFAALRFTPFLDELTADFAREAVERERIGQGTATDYLSISFSATDYIGHAYGPDSVEYEDNLLHLDSTLAALFDYLDQRVGWRNMLVVLSSDHGVDDIPEEKRSLGFAAGRAMPDEWLKNANRRLSERFNVKDPLIRSFVPPGFYLDLERIRADGLDAGRVASALAEQMRQVPGVAYAITRDDLLSGRLPRTPLMDKVQRAFHPSRSGDVTIVQQQFWYLYPDASAFAAMHGSPYSYDTFVPIIFAGAGIPRRTVRRPVDPASIAPTLAMELGVKPPSGCSAPPLREIVDSLPP